MQFSDTVGFPMAPAFPVIVVHLADPNYPKLTACGPALMPEQDPGYINYPRYQCPGCVLVLMSEEEER